MLHTKKNIFLVLVLSMGSVVFAAVGIKNIEFRAAIEVAKKKNDFALIEALSTIQDFVRKLKDLI